MKVFQTVQNNLRLLGYVRNHYGCRYYPFGGRNLIATLLFSFGTISISTFAIHTAENPAEFLDAFYVVSVLLSILASHTINTINMAQLFEFIGNCEKICNERKLFPCYVFELMICHYIRFEK